MSHPTSAAATPLGEELRRWQRLKEIVSEALERPLPERETFLGEACGGDDELRGRVSSLLRLAEKAQPFLEDSPVLGACVDFSKGSRIGRYQILAELGSGGMGEVYLAERADGAFEQDVALKVIRSSGILGELLERFISERQLLAELNHPNIARLLDGGTTDDGRPYLVMEYVEGQPIDEHCESRALEVEERLRLFLKVCDAVRHAHRHLVVHRDLKPANILVTAAGEPKLLDFGVAKDLGGDGKTPSTRLLLPVTPEYASPEQLTGGPASTAFDVYALGVVLYELLVGENPFRAGGDPLAGRSRAAPPRPPSAWISRLDGREKHRLRRRLAGDLDHVVLRALEPDPAHRYSSVEQLSRDLARYLRGLPLETRGGTLYRLGKLTRRHWKELAASVLVLLVAAFGILETSKRREAERESVRLEQQRERFSRISEDLGGFLVNLFLRADPGRTGERSEALERMLDHGKNLVDSGSFSDEPLVQAAFLGAIGQVYRRLDRPLEAEPLLRQSLALRKEELPADHRLIGVASNNLALTLRSLGHYQEARDLLLEVKRILSRRQLENPRETATLLNNLAGVEMELGRFDEAVDLYRQALATKRRSPDDFNPEDLVKAVKNLGVGLKAAGRLDEAEAAFHEALNELSGLEQPNPLVRAGVEHHLGSLMRERGDLAAARELLERTHETRLRLLGEAHRQRVETLLELALVDQLDGRLDVAEQRLRRVVELRRRHFGDQHPDTAEALVHLSTSLPSKSE